MSYKYKNLFIFKRRKRERMSYKIGACFIPREWQDEKHAFTSTNNLII